MAGLTGIKTVALLAGIWISLAPLPPRLAVNHQTRECTVLFGGDEYISTLPAEGWVIRLSNLRRVDLPAPLRPITPIRDPCVISRSTSRKAQNISSETAERFAALRNTLARESRSVA